MRIGFAQEERISWAGIRFGCDQALACGFGCSLWVRHQQDVIRQWRSQEII